MFFRLSKFFSFVKSILPFIVYFENFDAPHVPVVTSVIGANGRLTMMFSKSEYEFRDRNYTLYIYDKNGTGYEDTYDLSQSFDADNPIQTIVLKYHEADQHEFEVKEKILILSYGESRRYIALKALTKSLQKLKRQPAMLL